MTNKNKKSNNYEKKDWLTFELVLGIVVLAGIFFFPYVAIGLIFFGLLGSASANGTYWNSVGPVRGRNYENPYIRPVRRR